MSFFLPFRFVCRAWIARLCRIAACRDVLPRQHVTTQRRHGTASMREPINDMRTHLSASPAASIGALPAI
ncbi:hypothetical protein [Burkholderia sp. RF2-non_BP3]|uniref:hypothetical protein n=1 Tax=Burkholderia sp. RF2-non_BP3 TaxID=1637844 RepID=UPI0012E3C40A|nr:hypothetical protein [Burkholderia sp. RF2-non_BP3]